MDQRRKVVGQYQLICRDQQGQLEIPEKVETMARQSHLLLHHLAHKERKVLQAQRVKQVLQVHQEYKVLQALQDKMVLQDLPGLQVDLVEVALQVLPVQLARQAPQVRKDPPVRQR
jgi:hypothetical protein